MNRDSDIYKVRPRGQVVNEACQWIVLHSKLVIQIAVKPVLILAAMELLNLLFVGDIIITCVMVLLAVLLVPTIPSLAMYVVEHPEEFDYPRRTPKLMELWKIALRYAGIAIVVDIFGCIASLVLSVTLIGPSIMAILTSLLVVVCQREEDVLNIPAMLDAVKMTFKNLFSLMFMILGIAIITLSMIYGPLAIVMAMGYMFMNIIANDTIKHFLDNIDSDTYVALVMELAAVCGIMGAMTSMIIVHFFYGHCVMCAEEEAA